MPDRTPAGLLTAAADRLDALLAEATPGPWEWHPGLRNVKLATGGEWKPYAGTVLQAPSEMLSAADADYIAAMNPDVGRALVALLRRLAEARSRCGDIRSALGERGVEIVIPGYRAALDLARAILAAKEGA